MSSPLRVLTVCTHNRTRSVIAAFLLQERLAELGVDAVVSSAGTHAVDGAPATGGAARLLADRGLDAGAHQSRRVTAEIAADSDLIVTAERDHVVWIAGQWSGTFRRTYTLPELVRSGALVGPRNGRSVGEWLDAAAAIRPPPLQYLEGDGIPEVDDPTGASSSVWARSFEEIDVLTQRLAGMIA